MAAPSPHQALLRLVDDLEHHWSTDADLNYNHEKLISAARSIKVDPGDDESNITDLMAGLSRHVEQIIQKGQPEEFKTAILRTLADATREVPIWRPLFGLQSKADYSANLRQMKRETPPDSILEVARRIVAGKLPVSSSEQIRSALRIIANCCADNNVNRSILIKRDGVEDLLELLRNRQEGDLVIPVLYNVCVEYDEPATDAYGKPWTLPAQMQSAGGEMASGIELNAAEQRLGTYWFQYDRKTSFEILLKARDLVGASAGTLADLIEMASRVAFYGTENFVQEYDANEVGDMEVNTTPNIVRLLLNDGFELAKEDVDCRVSICQAVLNVLSQRDTHAEVVNDSSGSTLWNLVNLPYNSVSDDDEDDDEDEDEDENEAEQALMPYRKEILKLVYAVSATDTYPQTHGPQSPLIRNCIDSLKLLSLYVPSPPHRGLQASMICVLLANSITTTSRGEEFLDSHPAIIAPMLKSLLINAPSDSETLLPTIDLATRLALCSKGQDVLCAVEDEVACILPGITAVLHHRTHKTEAESEVDATGLEVQRNAVALARLLIKGRIQYVRKLNAHRSRTSSDKKEGASHSTAADNTEPGTLIGEVYHLYDSTNDAQTKLEIGRLVIEVLRTVYSSAPSSDSSSSETAESIVVETFGPFDSPTDSQTSRESKSTVTDIIANMLTQPQPQPHAPAQSTPTPSDPSPEGWFGLALLSNISASHASIRRALARDEFTLLKRLREIMAAQQQPSAPENEIDEGDVTMNSTPTTTTADRDPRVENIKVLVVKMLQSTSSSAEQAGHDRVQADLEAVAGEMGLDWVVV